MSKEITHEYPPLHPSSFRSRWLFRPSQPALAASKKADARAAALVAALQVVSPDPLGGRLGLALTAPRGEVAPVANTTSSVRGLTAQTDRDQSDYLVWKKSQKS